jgi:hypothetical protein
MKLDVPGSSNGITCSRPDNLSDIKLNKRVPDQEIPSKTEPPPDIDDPAYWESIEAEAEEYRLRDWSDPNRESAPLPHPVVR